MEVVINGEKQNLDESTGILDFLKSKGLRPEMVVIEYNGQIMPKEEWADIVLKENDKLEILRFVGGG